MEENKTGKYLKYAIGEIILVVIGILIALSINNWNNTKKDRLLESDYLKRLSSEIKDETEYYKRLASSFTNRHEGVVRMIERWKSEEIIITDSILYKRDFFAGSGVGPWYKEPITWTQLVQSGELKLIKDQILIETLYKYYGDVKNTAANFNQYPMQTTNEARKLLATTFVNDDFLWTNFQERDSIPLPKTFQIITDNKDAFKDLFVRMAVITKIQEGQMNRIHKSGLQILELLEKEQNSP